MYLAEQSWTDVDAAAVDVALLPIGSTEQHGPHAPLGTDFLLAETVAERTDEQSTHRTIVLPTLPYGIAEEHRAFAGTLWLSPDTFRTVIHDVVSSIAYHGIEHVVLVNGHGGNVAALEEVCARLTRDSVATAIPFTWFNAIESVDLSMGHAGAIETAALLASASEYVHSDRLDEAAAGGSDQWGRWIGGTNTAIDSNEFTENGVVGDPREATELLGEELLTQASAALDSLIASLLDTE